MRDKLRKTLIMAALLTGAGALVAPANGAATTPGARPTPFPARHLRTARVRNDMASAQRALDAAKMFLAKAPNDTAGHRTRAQQEVDAALADVNAALAAAGK